MLEPLLSQVTPGAIGIWSLLGVVVVALIRAWPVLQKIRSESDAGLRGDLLKRIADLEHNHDECLDQNNRLRVDMGNLIDGLRRQIVAYQIIVAERLPGISLTPEIDDMIARLKGPAEDDA